MAERLIDANEQARLAKEFKRIHSVQNNPFGTLLLVNVDSVEQLNVVLNAEEKAVSDAKERESGVRPLQAIATASFSVALHAGTDDDHMTWRENGPASVAIGRAVHRARPSLPLSVDVQDGYEQELEQVIEHVILQAGAVGINIEDAKRPDEHDNSVSLISVEQAAENVRRVIRVAKRLAVPDFVINARTDTLLTPEGTIDEAIRRGRAYLDAGATVVYVWGKQRGVRSEEVKRISEALQGRVNVKCKVDGMTLDDLRQANVARTSLGPQLYWEQQKGGNKRVEKVIVDLLQRGALTSI